MPERPARPPRPPRPPAALRPTRALAAEWRREAKALSGVAPLDYSDHWRGVWERAALAAASLLALRSGTEGPRWDLVPVDAVEAYVRHRRLAEFFRAQAAGDPFQSTGGGIVHAHPGWAMAQAEEKLARLAAEDLGLTGPKPSTVAGPAPSPTSALPAPESNGHGEAEGLVDDLVGPDGAPL